MNDIQVKEFIQVLQQYELSIAALYETFANILPSSKDTWLKFSKEERLHAKWINVLHSHMKGEIISFEQTNMTTQATKTSISYIESQIDKAKESQVDLKQALIIAIDIERSLLESAFLRVFQLKGSKGKKIQSKLFEATKAHIKGLIEWQANIRKA